MEAPGGGKLSLKVVRWPRLLEHLSGKLDGQPIRPGVHMGPCEAKLPP